MVNLDYITDYNLLQKYKNTIFVYLNNLDPWEDEDYNPKEFEFFVENIPDDAIHVAEFRDEVENVNMTWRLEANYYVCKVPDEENTYLLFDIAWDDNMGSYEINVFLAIRGCNNHEEAKPLLLKKFGQDNLPNAGGGEYEIFLRSLSYE